METLKTSVELDEEKSRVMYLLDELSIDSQNETLLKEFLSLLQDNHENILSGHERFCKDIFSPEDECTEAVRNLKSQILSFIVDTATT